MTGRNGQRAASPCWAWASHRRKDHCPARRSFSLGILYKAQRDPKQSDASPAAGLDQSRAVILLHPILVYMQQPHRDSERRCRNGSAAPGAGLHGRRQLAVAAEPGVVCERAEVSLGEDVPAGATGITRPVLEALERKKSRFESWSSWLRRGLRARRQSGRNSCYTQLH